MAAEDLLRKMQAPVRIGTALGKKIGNFVSGAIAEIGEDIAELFQERDSWIMGVEIGPLRTGQALQLMETLAAQRCVVQSARELWVVTIHDAIFFLPSRECGSMLLVPGPRGSGAESWQ
ncbi:MAG TPA: hypothetical protein VFK02_00930 [Kofleriaceae bacterium]|nr:hypothetical protein [Kofleriaceae bacterium]